MIAQRAYSNPPFRRGLADFMAETEQRAPRAYDTMLGAAPVYDRTAALPEIFSQVGDMRAVGTLPNPTFPDDPVRQARELLITHTVIAGLVQARAHCRRLMALFPALYQHMTAKIDAALQGERRIRIEQIALQRMMS